MSNVNTAEIPTRTELDGLVYEDYGVRVEMNVAAPGTKKLIPIPAGKTVVGVRVRVLAACNGTTPTLTVGDTANAAGYLASGDVDPAVLNAFASSPGLGSNAFAKGKHYAAADSINVVLAGAGMNTGKLAVTVIFDGFDAIVRRDLVN